MMTQTKQEDAPICFDGDPPIPQYRLHERVYHRRRWRVPTVIAGRINDGDAGIALKVAKAFRAVE